MQKLPSEDQLSVKTFSGLERLSLCPPSHDDKDIFKNPPITEENIISENIHILLQRKYSAKL